MGSSHSTPKKEECYDVCKHLFAPSTKRAVFAPAEKTNARKIHIQKNDDIDLYAYSLLFNEVCIMKGNAPREEIEYFSERFGYVVVDKT